MELSLYNTLTRKKEKFIPLISGKVGMYSCGPTVYSTPHIGNLRATFTADLLRNTFKLLGYEVKAVMNITDVGHLVSDGDEGEDKMEKGAKKEGKTAKQIAETYEKIFKDNMKDLNIEEFDKMPRATDHIEEQIDLIKKLEEKGYTYIVESDGIYMDTSKVENYGELMGPNYKKRLADLNAGERVDMRGKKHATDFALWKFSPIGEKRQMERESPWGIGFPGWHIECSAMSSKYLGEQFDIHHGGADHITIHHPNEIAQSECAFSKKPWVKYRVHNEFLQVDGGKMSKSLGNVYTLDDIKAKGYSPLDLRYFYFMAQYGNFQNFTWEALKAAKRARKNLMKYLFDSKKYLHFENNDLFPKLDIFFKEKIKNNSDINEESLAKYFSLESSTSMFITLLYNVLESLLDNINIPQILSYIYSEKYLDENMYILIQYIDDNLLKLGLFDYIDESLFVDIKNLPFDETVSEDLFVYSEELTCLIRDRIKAKQDKNYILADELREKIKNMGYEMKDTKDGYEINKI